MGRAAATVKMASAAGAMVWAAKCRTIWHKTDGKWLNIHAMWNDHVPPRPSQPPRSLASARRTMWQSRVHRAETGFSFAMGMSV